MTSNQQSPLSDWVNAFLPLGCIHNDAWESLGGSILIVDNPFVWLITSQNVIVSANGEDVSTWIPTGDGTKLLNLTDAQKSTQVDWLHHPSGLSASVMPLDPSFQVKAFAEAQCTRIRNLQPLQPAATVGGLMRPDLSPTPVPVSAFCDGIISAVNEASGAIYSTAPMLPGSVGGPLLLVSPHTGDVSIAGVLIEDTIVSEANPRIMPIRMSRAICINAVFDLIRSTEALDVRKRLTERAQAPQDQAAASDTQAAKAAD